MTRLLAALLLLAGLASPAFAHALLRKAVPGVGSTVAIAPPTVTLTFSEGVEPSFTTVEVMSAGGVHMEYGGVAAAGGDQKTISVKLKPLPPGAYTVQWHATSVDTHKTDGKFTFTVTP
jgi:copper resistance protein C